MKATWTNYQRVIDDLENQIENLRHAIDVLRSFIPSADDANQPSADEARQMSVTERRAVILAQINRHVGGVAPCAIRDALGVRRHHVTNDLRVMEALGFVVNGQDGWQITDAGRAEHYGTGRPLPETVDAT